MNFRTRSSNITKVLYTVLILCIISIAILSVYSAFNKKENQNTQNNQNNKNGNILLNEEDYIDSEDALFDFFNKNTTESQAQPKTQAPTNPPATNPKPTENIIIPPVTESKTEVITEIVTDPEPLTDKTADIIVEPDDTAIEVLSVPSVFLKPVEGRISRAHNPDIPEYSIAMNDYRTHMGIDIDSEVGVNVKCVSDGVVSEIYDDPMMGKTVVVDHHGNIQSIYMNLQDLLPKNITVGTELKSGDIIGGVGETALIEMYDVPHLHFEMKKDGSYTDPLDYIPYK